MSDLKELHNQPVLNRIPDSSRIASGVPHQTAADNHLFTDLLNSFMQRGQNVALTTGVNRIDFDLAFLSANYTLFIRSYNGIGYEITTQDSAGFNIEVLGSTNIDYTAFKV